MHQVIICCVQYSVHLYRLYQYLSTVSNSTPGGNRMTPWKNREEVFECQKLPVLDAV